jgi:hypothetical protein
MDCQDCWGSPSDAPSVQQQGQAAELQPRPRRPRCSGGQRGRRGRAAAEASAASAASAAGADARPADPPAAASCPSCKGQGCKTESVMIGMNALIYLEYAAGTLSVECTDEQSMYSVQTVPKMMKLVCKNSVLNLLCTYTVRTQYYERCTYKVHALYVQNMVKVHTVYISVQNYTFCTYTIRTFDF